MSNEWPKYDGGILWRCLVRYDERLLEVHFYDNGVSRHATKKSWEKTFEKTTKIERKSVGASSALSYGFQGCVG